MAQLIDLSAQLSGDIPGLPQAFARKHVNEAFAEVKRERLWSWNIGEGILLTPQILQGAGTVSVVNGNPFITFDTIARSAIAPFLLQNPPFIQYQFRVGAGPIYNYVTYDPSTGIAMLDRIYGETTFGGATFATYKCYYGPPSVDGTQTGQVQDFLRYLSINNTTQGYVISGRRLYMTREELNRRDPLRGAQGNPYYAATYRPTPNSSALPQASGGQGIMLYELWPHPTYQQSLLCQYEKDHFTMQPYDYFPVPANLKLIQFKAQEYAYRWAIVNQGRIPELRGVDWRYLLEEVKRSYSLELVTAKRQDNEIMLNVLRPGSAGIYDFEGPIDSNFYQSHGLPAL